MIEPVVSHLEPVTLVGGGHLAPDTLNISRTLAPALVAADGGANFLLDQRLVPLAVIGDLDSISTAAQAQFQDRLCHITEQDSTDFEKCLERIVAPCILACGFLGGRLDHQLSVLNVLARIHTPPVILVGTDEIALVAPPMITITLPPKSGFAILPLEPAVVTTTGLKWDLTGAELSPVGAISSSNQVVGPDVTVKTQGKVLITCSLAALPAAIDAVRAK